MQDGKAETSQKLGLALVGSGRVNQVSEVEPLVEAHLKKGYHATTLHVGWGTESDRAIDLLVSEIISIADSHNYPLYVETHRATITQDNWRTTQIVRRFPEIRFNGDFSHRYTGHEMVYGDWKEKLEFIKPVLERVRFIHGRISTPGSIQAPLLPKPTGDYVAHFRELWQHCFEGFLKSAQAGNYLIFAPELLTPKKLLRPNGTRRPRKIRRDLRPLGRLLDAEENSGGGIRKSELSHPTPSCLSLEREWYNEYASRPSETDKTSGFATEN